MKFKGLLNPAFLAALAALAAGGVGLGAMIRFADIHLQKLPIEPASGLRFHTLPTETQSWRRVGQDQVMSEEVLQTLGTENYVSRVYRERNPAPDADRIEFELHCAYYTGTIDTVPHVPERCFVGGGMSMDGGSRIVEVPLEMDRFPIDHYIDQELHGGVIRTGRTTPGVYVHMPRDIETLKMNVTRFRDRSGRRFYAGYFFLANGGHVATANGVRSLAFKLNDSHAYYAKVQFMSYHASSAEELAQVAADFLNEMFPDIVERTPNWVDVVEGRYPAKRMASGGGGDGGVSGL
ncbi:MAG: exosortase-associated EpsI family protein [Phycisphaeraceae bacterium]|nr:MAG: exosortase-associated EpsI family protein [Phycisphaeraceae bacterium]